MPFTETHLRKELEYGLWRNPVDVVAVALCSSPIMSIQLSEAVNHSYDCEQDSDVIDDDDEDDDVSKAVTQH